MKSKIKSLLLSVWGGYKLLDSRYPFGHSSSKLRKLKNKYKGKRCFIIGNGPSLNKHDLSLLKDEYTFGVNSIFLKTKQMGFKPTFYVVEDLQVMMDNLTEINKFDCQYKFFPTNYKKYITDRENVSFFKMNTGYYNQYSPFFCLPRFSPDASDILYCGQNVTMLNIQLAYHFGFNEVYLIGMDHSYIIPKDADVNGEVITSNSDDPNHFDSSYFGKGKKWHNPHLDRVERTYSFFKLVFEGKKRLIKNATVGGKLEVFERIDFNSLFLKEKQ